MPRCWAVACLCFTACASLAGAPALRANPDETAASNAYRQAMDSFNKGDYERALSVLDHAPKSAKSGEQADVANLRGAIYLHLRKYDEARDAFATAKARDPDLWAARYNEAEVSFREKKYADSARQFDELLGKTGRLFHSDERGFLQYKVMLAQLLAGKEKAAEAYVAEHRGDRTPPLAYYYLNAALEHRHGRTQQAGQWLAQADAQYSPASEQVLAESFRSLGWFTERSDKVIAAARRHDGSSATPTAMAVVELMPGGASPSPANALAANPSPAMAIKTAAAAPIGREVTLPGTETPPIEQPDARATPAASTGTDADLEAAQMPPSAEARATALPGAPSDEREAPAPLPEHDAASAAVQASDPRAVYSTPVVLGKPARGHSNATPSPSDSPASSSPSPADSSADSSSASPSASPSPGSTLPPSTPAPAFMEKYEQALVKIEEKNYPAAQELLSQAEAIQPNQPDAAKLRTQIFKHYYEAAYIDYKKGDYPTTIERLDDADSAQPNQPDALNLRGLTLSKQKDYEHAESAFKRAIQADPAFWAARFNYAELPFNYRNYTAARTRFEELYAQTDATKQPREAELTQFKVFLTLLLEGKVDGARSFMQHFSFSGATPARYFCQSALDFYAGNMSQAQSEIDDAAKDFPPQLMAIFKESFFRIGWLNDNPPAAPGGSPITAGSLAGAPAAPATAAGSPAVSPAGSPTLAAASAAPSTPPVAASATPKPAAGMLGAVPAGTPAVAAASVAPAAAGSSPKPAAGGMGAVLPGTPALAATKGPGGSPAAAPALALSGTPSPAKSPVMLAAASPAPSAAPGTASPALAAALPTVAAPSPALLNSPALPGDITPGPGTAQENNPGEEAASTPEAVEAKSPKENILRLVLVVVVFITALWSVLTMLMTLASRKPRQTVPIKRQPIYSAKEDALEHDRVETPR